MGSEARGLGHGPGRRPVRVPPEHEAVLVFELEEDLDVELPVLHVVGHDRHDLAFEERLFRLRDARVHRGAVRDHGAVQEDVGLDDLPDQGRGLDLVGGVDEQRGDVRVVDALDHDCMQLPDGAELPGLAVGNVRSGVLGDGLEDDRLIDLLVGGGVEEHEEVSVLVAVGLVLTVDARWKTHHQALRVPELIGGEDFHVHQVDGVVGKRLESRISREGLEHFRQRGWEPLRSQRGGRQCWCEEAGEEEDADHACGGHGLVS